MKNKYGLLFKTGESEIRALKNFSNRKGIFPIIELTRGRKTKKDTVGDIQKRIDQLYECFGNMDVILDLTAEPALSSEQIDMLYIPDNGYKNWVNFLIEIKKKKLFKNIYPSMLLTLDDVFFEDNLKKQIFSILENFNGISYRCNIEDEGYTDDLEIISTLIPVDKNFFFIIDCSYIRASELTSCKEKAVKIIKEVYKKIPHTSFILASTSFPDKLGEDNFATLFLTEISLYEEVSNAIPDISIMYSDYGSINPIRNDNVIMSNGWRPRIDVPLKTEIFYNRKKKNLNGYASTYSLVASDAINDDRFPSDLDNWGINQIMIAADGASPGASPSFWISVRMNIYIEQQLRRLLLR